MQVRNFPVVLAKKSHHGKEITSWQREQHQTTMPEGLVDNDNEDAMVTRCLVGVFLPSVGRDSSTKTASAITAARSIQDEYDSSQRGRHLRSGTMQGWPILVLGLPVRTYPSLST
jgi:hypothetical protein